MRRGMARPGAPVLPGMLVLVGVLLAAAGCGSDAADAAAVSASGAPSGPSSSPSPSPSTGGGAGAAGSPAGGVAAGGGGAAAGGVAGGGAVVGGAGGTGGAGGSAGVGRCPAARLSVASTDGEGAAGSTYERLLLTNTGTTACALLGFPGVSYVDAAGRQVGAAASRSGPAGVPLTLGAGSTASATLRTVHPGLQQGCDEPGQTTPVAALLVYPPGDTAALRLPLTGVEACTDPAVGQLSVTALIR